MVLKFLCFGRFHAHADDWRSGEMVSNWSAPTAYLQCVNGREDENIFCVENMFS